MDEQRIKLLPSLIANQIAAGEVIERPASVVKELLENALDAKASKITIEIGSGGLNRIIVSDNGTGIHPDDLPLALETHATSKITQLNDLERILTMGFRGEALASIASIAKVTITSRMKTKQHAMRIETDAGMTVLQPAARTQGTTVEVCDLFYNAPVRRKFLKNTMIEFQAIESLVKRFALAVPEITVSLIHDGKCCFELLAATSEKTYRNRVQKIFGKEFIENALWVDEKRGSAHLYGFISSPKYQRSQNDKQWIYLNRRMVKDKLLLHALRQAYDSLLVPGKNSAFVLHLDLEPSEVDVNVHPTKHEVRFEQGRWVHDFILSTLENILIPNKDAEPSQILPKYPTSNTAYKHLLPEESNQWVVLNKQFVLLFVNDGCYMVDGLGLYTAYFRASVNRAEPISMRTLLLPIDYKSFPVRIRHILSIAPALLQAGVYIERQQDPDSLLIKAIPTLLPQLNIGSFFDALAMSKVEIDLIDLLIAHTDFDAKDITPDLKTELLNYGLEIIKQMQTEITWVRQLGKQQCQDFMAPNDE